MSQKEKIEFLIKQCEEQILVNDDCDFDFYFKGKGIARAAEVLGVVTYKERRDFERTLLKAMERKYTEIKEAN